VRVVHSWFASTDDWDGQFEQHEFGWRSFFRILKAYLSRFPGQTGTVVQLTSAVPVTMTAAWAKLTGTLGLDKLQRGTPLRLRPDAPKLEGTIEYVGEGDYTEEALLRIDAPAPGFVHLFAMPMGGVVLLIMRLFVFGPDSSAVATREKVRRDWLSRVVAPAP